MNATLAELYEAASAFDLRRWEDQGVDALGPLVERTCALLRDTIALTRTLSDPHAAHPRAGKNFNLTLDALVRTNSRVSDVAFVSGIELQQRLARLERPPTEAWSCVCDCGSALRRVTKTLAALDHAAAEAEGRAPTLRYDSELELSLRVRRLYRKVWTFVHTLHAPEQDVRTALRGAGTLIAVVTGRDEYCRLRPDDRRQLRDLQARILAWLKRDHADLKAGARLWEDFAAFATMLRAINFRQELAQHDASLIEEALHTLTRSPELTGELHARLRNLEGLDDSLDDALRARAGQTVTQELVRLRARFSAPPDGAGNDGFF